MNFTNCTPHDLVIVTSGGDITLARSGVVTRVEQFTAEVGTENGIPVCTSALGAPEWVGGPDPGGNVVVSAIAAGALVLTGRLRVYSPGTLVRDAAGRPVGCTGLVRWS